MLVQNFVEEFKNKKVQNTKTNDHAVADYIKQKLEIKTYLPFAYRKVLVQTIVDSHIEVVDGIKKYDNVNSYIGFIIAMIKAHTNLEFSQKSIDDYDLLAETGLLAAIVEEFRTSYEECEVLRKMMVAAEMQDNEASVIIGKFLNNIIMQLAKWETKLQDVDVQTLLNEILTMK